MASDKLEFERHKRVLRHRHAFAGTPLADEVSDARVAALVARGLDLGEQRLGRSTPVCRPAHVDLERQLQRLVERRQRCRSFASAVLRHCLDRLAQPLGNRVARQPRHLRYLALRLLAPDVQTPDSSNHVHGDHSSNPAAQKSSRIGETPGSVFGRHDPQKWLNFRSAPTPLCPARRRIRLRRRRTVAPSWGCMLKPDFSTTTGCWG